MWQSLSFGANYKAAYCMAVCPAGDDVIGPFLKDRKGFLEGVVQPLQKKSETVYVVPDTLPASFASAPTYSSRTGHHEAVHIIENQRAERVNSTLPMKLLWICRIAEPQQDHERQDR